MMIIIRKVKKRNESKWLHELRVNQVSNARKDFINCSRILIKKINLQRMMINYY